MAITRERKTTSPDLDIFGDDDEGAAVERQADEKSMDIFGEDSEEEAAKSEQDAAAEPASTATDTGEPDWASIFGEDSETKPEDTVVTGNEEAAAQGDETLDPEIDDLLKQAEDASEKDERDDIIAELRRKLVDQQVELDATNRHKEILNEKLMASSASDTELGLYKEAIAKLESNPKLKALVRYAGSDEESAKKRMTGILGDMLEELTGEDVGSMLDKTRTDKTKAALGNSSSAGVASKGEEDKPMDYEESISSLF